MNSITCCFTGHRKIPEESLNNIKELLRNELISLILEGYTRFCAGGALGFDTIAAQEVLSLKCGYSEINLALILPCKEQYKNWSACDKAEFMKIYEQADEIIYTSQEYFPGCMYKRDRRLVTESSVCIAYLSENTGGTFYTVGYAEKHNLRVINLAEKLDKIENITK